MDPMYLWAVVYCLLIVCCSLAGGWFPLLVRYTHLQMQVVLSFVGGLMLGVAMFHLLPHGIFEAQNVDLVILWTMAGLLIMFFLIRALHFHQHGPDEDHQCEAHDHAQEHHASGHDHDCGHGEVKVHRFSWLGVAFGLSLHTLIDGLALGAAIMADAAHSTQAWFPGVAIFLAIVLHKPLDAMSITTMMTASGWDVQTRLLVNLGFAMMCPIGAFLLILGLGRANPLFLGCALGFSAGVFLCISLGDLLPEVHFHRHDRIKLSVALLLGVAVAYGIGFLEPEHLHGANGVVLPVEAASGNQH